MRVMKMFFSYFGPSIVAVVTVLALRMCCEPAQAATTSACYNITDSDARSYCIAKSRGDLGQCYNIQRADLRSMCLAEVRK